jgi:hypothetical protein
MSLSDTIANANANTDNTIDQSDLIDQSDITEQQNFIEAKVIIQEFHDDSSVFIVGSAPFGKLWFDQEKVDKQYGVLCENWAEDYDDGATSRSKKPRIISVLISEHDPMFDDFRETIRETQARKNLIHELAMQMKIAEAVRAAMAAAGIPYADLPPLPVSLSALAPESVQEAEPVVAPAQVKEKKPRVKKAVPEPAPTPAPVSAPAPTPIIEQNVVMEKKPTKPRQKKASA